ncbi:hypothetical protein GQ457_03G013790 [Hibiscus cannabinus]
MSTCKLPERSDHHHLTISNNNPLLTTSSSKKMKWLQGLDHDFCDDVLYPSSSTVVAPCVTSTIPPTPPLGRVLHVLVSAMAHGPWPPIPPARRNEWNLTKIQNFVNFFGHKTMRMEQSNLSNSKSVARELTVVDSSDTLAMAPESGASQAMLSSTKVASGGDNNNACACTNMNVDAATISQSTGVA